MWKVIAIDQYGVQTVMYHGPESACQAWIGKNADLYPSYEFFTEPVQ